MIQSASYSYSSVGTTNWPSATSTNAAVSSRSGISFRSSGVPCAAANIVVTSSATFFGSTNISVGSSATLLSATSTGQMYGSNSPTCNSIGVERSDILTIDATGMLPELLDQAVCYYQNPFLS